MKQLKIFVRVYPLIYLHEKYNLINIKTIFLKEVNCWFSVSRHSTR